MKIRVFVSFKDTVLDPQGQTVKNALLTMGYNFVKDVRQGKVFEIETDDIPEEKIKKYIPELADKVLTNPIIEKFSWEIME
jgi:phosphoribosylformylglycinamidine synthase PurS subunit